MSLHCLRVALAAFGLVRNAISRAKLTAVGGPSGRCTRAIRGAAHSKRDRRDWPPSPTEYTP